MDARNAALRDQVEDMLVGLRKQTRELKAAQEQAANATGEARTPDGGVAVAVNASGVVTDVRFTSWALIRNTPDQLGQLVVRTIQAAAADARAKSDAAMAPLRQNLPDLTDLFPDAPSLTALNTAPPPLPEPGSGPAAPPVPPRPQRRSHAEEPDDEPLGSIMRKGYR
ncbi:hypothetical protein ALI144C_48635 [Actinosynnema sp. ALI-1.44]|nr:hypothetical protein ALI144C_48635 [Actinosynnema sp. ALI-1.44]